MPTELPTTTIGLIAFIIAAAGWLIWKLNQNNTSTVTTFMTYIEKKNGNLERATAAFLESTEKKNKQFEIMLADHDKRHGAMMDDMAARLEATLPVKK